MTNPYPETQVDLEMLAAAADQLEQIQRFVETHCLGAMPSITEALGATSNIDMSDVEYKFTREATVFGGFYSAYGMQASHDSIYRAVQDGLKNLVQHFGQAAEATRTMVDNYRAVEERNTAIADNFTRVLDRPAGGTAV